MIEPGQLALPGWAGNHRLRSGRASACRAEGVRVVDLERDMLLQSLGRSCWNVTAAARLLGVSRDTVRYRMRKHGLPRPS